MRRVLFGVLAIAAAAPAQNSAVPPEVRLGGRVETLRRAWPVAPLVVIADSPGAYLDAIGRWSPTRRFPVLLDDGTDAAREDIARFVRAFAPERVRVLSTPGNSGYSREAIERAAAAAWGAEDEIGRRALWEQHGFTPPGVVVADERDDAWPAAAALAAGRGEPIVWVRAPKGRAGSRMSAIEQRDLSDAVEAAVRTWGWSWDTLGDDLDAVTICLNAPTKTSGGDGEILALTDVIGRSFSGERWAFAGAIVGSESESAYRAMCALFLQPSDAWLFNGYTGGGAFQAYDTGPAGELLEQAGLMLQRDGRTPTGVTEWAQDAAGGVRAGLVFVNTSGTRRRFDLAPGRSYGVDIPLLHAPSAVHFIHSFSAQNLDDRSSIARAWLDQGAFVYVGSVDEPFLQAFVPPALLTRRLLASAPVGAAARVSGSAWKINVLGDPLYTLGPPAPAFEEALDFEGLRSVERTLSTALESRDFDSAGRLLALLGRDGDVVDLARAVLADEAQRVGAGLAGAATLAAVRAGDLELVGRLWTALDPTQREDPRLLNPVWHLIEPALATTTDPRLVGLASASVRRGRYARDATLAARATARVEGNAAAGALLARLIEDAPDKRSEKELREQLSRY